ncbi:Ankyrin repeat domain-containing protein 50 [Daldinia childiae]|uniref:Ankyrin repeat domain-containing protein 50 n=1 Tax=Daldinia childiae TaxID=326645 RepID=UPI00144718DC|nr:Ankyrin repeat domain-containing protein 50 [Daldinia childiae]KAF3055258.1 Ankyrin repeat domain-containing protein 50 [Daldinia childiae]
MDSSEEDVSPSLWDQAFNILSDKEKLLLKFDRFKTPHQPSDIIQVVEGKKKDCEKKQWVLYTNEAGQEVKVRDVLGKVCDWLVKFREIGDAAVQFDPGHAALPWMAVRALLQMSVNDCQTFGAMVESIEAISSIVARYTEVEARILLRTSNLTKQLSGALVKLYGSSLRFLAHASRYYEQKTFKRTIKSTINTVMSQVEEPMLSIAKQEEEVFKLVSLVNQEINGMKIDDIINLLRQGLENSQISDEGRVKRLSAWINGIDTKNTYETALQYRHEGTCEWVIKLPEFYAWISNEEPRARLLWIHGPPGFGKTFLSARIIQHLRQQKHAPLSYFFCVADNQLTRDPYAILRSCLTQMIDQDDRIMFAMNSVYKAQKQEQTLTHLGLWELFVSIGEVVEGCTFVIDGFDECIDIDKGTYHHDDPRNLFLCDLLKYLQKTKSRMMVVSRDVPDIREYLGQEASGKNDTVERLVYGITAKDTSADIQSFSTYMVNKKLFKKSDGLRQQIASQATERSEGMFLLIKLLEKEISPGQNAKQLKRTVTEMPSGIEDAYSRELDKITRMEPSKKEQAVMILRWVLFAIRPLQVKQLTEALVVSDEDLDEYPEDDLPDSWNDGFVDEDYVKEMILGPCGSLLQLRASSKDIPLADHTVHFVHFSVKEYLSNLANHASPNQWAVKLNLKNALAEEVRLSNICLRYLTLNKSEDSHFDTVMYPFLSYASWAWWKVWTPLMEAELINTDMEEWDYGVISVSDASSETDGDDSHKSLSQEVQNPIYYASLLGLMDVVKWLEDKGLEFGCVGGRFGFPLQAAVARNHEELVEYLLNSHVDVSQKGGLFGASIIAAAATAAPRIVDMLLSAGADIAAVDESGYTALHHAAKRGSIEIIELLLNHSADINAVTADFSTAASLAYWSGHKDTLSVLVQRGVDLTPDGDNAKPLLKEAIEEGDEGLVDMLLAKGVSPNTIFRNGSSALNSAIRSRKLVEMFLKKGADPNMVDENGWAPLPLAAGNKNIDIVKALVDVGASIVCDSESDPEIQCPLQVAVINNCLPVAKFLVEQGASLDQKTRGGHTALMFAVSMKHQDMAEWLLDMGASVQGIYEYSQQSLFDIAVETSDPDITELLVRRGCFQIHTHVSYSRGLVASEARGDNSLVMLAYQGNLEGVKKCLVNTGGSSYTKTVGEALHAASARGHLHIVDALLSNHANAGMVDTNGRTALHHATRHLYFNVADILVEHGASILLEDMAGSTAIDLAIIHGLKAYEFIKNHMSDFTVGISRRPSLLAVAPKQPTSLTAIGIRKAISGSWTGHYDYLYWADGRSESFSIDIPAEAHKNSQPSTFSNENRDLWGLFKFHGFVDSSGTVWFIKLYETLGWLYRGRVDPEKGTLKGTWGSNRKLWFGTFQLRKEE